MNLVPADKRLFLGIPLALRFQETFEDILDSLQRVTEGVKWVTADQIHATLHFFGNVPAQRLSEIRECVTSVCAGFRPIPLGTGGLGFFPDEQSPRVIWLHLSGDVQSLEGLQQKLDSALAACGFSVEERPFRAHATLGRIKNPRQFRIRGEQKIRANLPESFDTVALYESVLGPQGARYEILEQFSLAARA